MTINIERVGSDKLHIPAVAFIPKQPQAYAVVVHGYGGCKEEQFGLAWRLAENGVHAISIDLRGHGENEQLFDDRVFEDVQDVVGLYQGLGQVIAIGHSLGGRFCLLSQADYKIGVSPALSQSFSQATQQFITQMRSHRVREKHPGINFETLHSLPIWCETHTSNTAIVYAARDVPEIKLDCENLKKEGVFIEQVDNTSHADIYLARKTFEIVEMKIRSWLES